MGVEVVCLVFGSLFSSVVMSVVSGVELEILFQVFVSINVDRKDSCVASWVCVSDTSCLSGIIVLSDCAFFCSGDVLHLFSVVRVAFGISG